MDSRISQAACWRLGFDCAAIALVMATALLSPGASFGGEAPQALSAAELAREIDIHIDRSLQAKQLAPSPPASDAEFLRRAYLDIAGVIPPLAKVEPFLSDSSPDKRARLIDELLKSEEYVRHMTDQWREHLIPNTAAAARRRHETGLLWLEDAFRVNLPYDEFIGGVLTADGMQRDNGATTFLLTHQSLDEVTDRLSRVLLGVQIICAQCHNHPFAAWKQEDYWGTAAFFSKVRHQYEKIDRVEHYGVSERGDRKPLMTPPSVVQVAPTFLGGAKPEMNQDEPYLPVFVDWLVSSENPYFARAFVNRLWRTVMGRGLVEPVDDLRDENPGTHPELLTLLGAQFHASGFDIHYVFRAIMLSNAYQRTSRSLDANQHDNEWYSHMPIRVMTPHARGDSVQMLMRIGDPPQAAPTSPAPEATPDEKLKASQRARGSRDSFANYFKGEDNPSPVAYEAGVPQALRMMNHQDMHRGSRVVSALGREHRSPEAMVKQIYLAALTRRPMDEEREIVLRYVKSQPDVNRAMADVVWTLLNSAEFVTNH